MCKTAGFNSFGSFDRLVLKCPILKMTAESAFKDTDTSIRTVKAPCTGNDFKVGRQDDVYEYVVRLSD